MAAASQVSASSFNLMSRAGLAQSARPLSIPLISASSFALPLSSSSSSSLRGAPIGTRSCRMKTGGNGRGRALVVRCEQSSDQGSGVDVWLGRLAMIGFAAALSVEVATGKGLLENFGLASPLPTVALALTALVGVLTAIFIFQSASKD